MKILLVNKNGPVRYLEHVPTDFDFSYSIGVLRRELGYANPLTVAKLPTHGWVAAYGVGVLANYFRKNPHLLEDSQITQNCLDKFAKGKPI